MGDTRTVVTRFAPSPTGFMHVGSVRTALFAWLYARKHGGRFILRIEDTDKEREVAGTIPHINETLSWLGITRDEGVGTGGPHAPYLQSERLAIYRSYAEKLVAAGHAYADPYTVDELEAFRAQAQEEHRPFLYRDHRPKTTEPWDGSRPLRLRAPSVRRYSWHDAVHGDLSAGEEAVDDFILIKSDGYPTYNFAHIVDDIEMEVTHVMRGEEFISSTPKFLSLYEALQVAPPIFATLPVILGPDGKKKLSKRDGAKDILEYRAEGYLPEALVNYLALLGWNPGTEQEYFSVDELIAAFDLDRIQTSGARFDDTKLKTINQHWLRKLSDQDFLQQLNTLHFDADWDAGLLKKVLPLLKERAHTFAEAKELLEGELRCIASKPALDQAVLLAKEPAGRSELTREALAAAQAALDTLLEQPTADEAKAAIMPLADTEEAKGKGGRGAVLWPLRYALSGLERSPDPFTLISILGKKESLERIASAQSSFGAKQ